jgi:limonene-1,2-epoxide hydrolase
MSNEDVIRAVMSAWGESIDASVAATLQHFADDCVWEQTGLPTTTGPEEAAQMMRSMADMGFASIGVEFRNVVASGDVVCTERVDTVFKADGSVVGSFPVVGVTEFRDGKISAWREYFDSAHLAQLG